MKRTVQELAAITAVAIELFVLFILIIIWG